MRSSAWATVLIAACIVAPQIVVAIFSEWVGRMAGVWGRRPLLLVAFATLPVRGVLFAVVTDPYALVAVQLLDGVAGAVLAVVVTLVVVDLTRGTGHFNLGQGLVGTGMGIGASLSTTLAGYLTDRSGSSSAFTGLAAVAVVALVAVWALVKETKPADPNGSAQSPPRQKRALALVRPDIRLPGRKRVEWTRWLRSRLRWAQCSPAVRRLFAGATPLRVSRHRNEFAAEASTSEPSRELLAAPKTIEAPDGHRPDGRPVAADS